MGPRTGMDDAKKRKILPYRDSNSYSSAVQPVASHCTDWAIRAEDNGDFSKKRMVHGVSIIC
jgi:hypothetical protein